MTEHTKEFLSHYPESYGWNSRRAPDYSRCCEKVSSTGGSWGSGPYQCSRKNGHGPDSAFCKQHDPVEKQKRSRRKRAEETVRSYERHEERQLAAAVGRAVLGGRDPQPFVDAYRKRKAEIEQLSRKLDDEE